MQYIILISNPNYGLEEIKQNIPKEISVEMSDMRDTLWVDYTNSNESIIIRLDNGSLEDFDEEEMKFINATVGEHPQLYIISYKNIEDLKKLLKLIANRTDIIIDNDCEVTTTGEDFINICNSKPGWDWLKE